MPFRTPRWLSSYCRRVTPLLVGHVDAGGMLDLVEAVVDTDKWSSFDRYHQTTDTLTGAYERAGASAEIHRIPTGGPIGTGRWVVQQAADVVGATVDVVRPRRKRIVDYQRNPWQVVRWTAGTPAEGLTCKLAVVDSEDELKRLGSGAVAGRMVLTRSHAWRAFAQQGAAGVLIESAVPNHPGATSWTSFGWGGPRLSDAASHLVGLVVSADVGRELRELAKAHGDVVLQTHVNVRRYVGSHDLVCGVVRGGADPQDEVWALAHSLEPGAVDNASGVAVCVEIARLIEHLSAAGRLARPKRTIRLLNGHECYSFFHYLEHERRMQTPLAGVCIDCVGIEPALCDRRLEWHATVPSSAGFVDGLGEAVVRAALRAARPGYRCVPMPFACTSDTLIGDPKYGFPCPWIATYRGHKRRGYDAYHSSADAPGILSREGLGAIAAAMAGYLYFLADADTDDAVRLAEWETDRVVAPLARSRRRVSAAQAEFTRHRHHVSMRRLERWLWGGDRADALGRLADCERRVREALDARTTRARRASEPKQARRVPRRTALLAPTLENTPEPVAESMRTSGLPAWALFWADGQRTLARIADMVACETGKPAAVDATVRYFEAHAELGYVDLVEPDQVVTRAAIVRDLRALGVRAGMLLMVHSSLSAIGHVAGGADAVVDALLAAVGRSGTLVMPSFNHSTASVYNPLATPTIDGAIPDAFWRRPEAVRSEHPSHAVAAIGPGAEALCRGHLEAGIWAADSPIGRLVHGGGYILSLGVRVESRTAYHVAEISVPCRCIDMFGSNDRMVGPDGQVRSVRGLAWRSTVCPVSAAKLDETLDRRQLQKRARVGRADATLVQAIDLWRVRREHLRRVCPTCEVRPKHR